ncbi:hypothetical protein A1O3_03255 [Capronia epimyces CBS 606.96]|uniref:Zn(2)-C6 fungal-type domain-containing protein n=1 Tax=Capronia epimyces CBS 606.96 TaxID=1182542 RepID=W9YVK1_9EURO|nr:uncharacterized protein A1O3_03255 [Capronia epimyces CBS 606.96]EXJ86304.1 hypothetical protein A1O3_03255 [Capronia epimyces CBS 606.96]
MKSARPYRSHRYPACTRCHQRRSRCLVEVPGQACSRCHRHGVPCSLANTKKDDSHGHESQSPKIGFIHRSLLADARSLESNARVVGPVMARDTQILEQYLHLPPASTNGRSIQRETQQQQPIYQVPIPPRMPSPTGCQCSRNLPQELLAQVDPFLDKLMSNYFEHIEPCFPLTDEHYIMTRIQNRSTLPQTFLVILVSHALFYWDLSPTLTAYVRPDQDLAWQTSVALNAASLQKGDIATISTICIGTSGRPYQRLVHNVANVARTVALAYTIGLNHDCSEWKIRDLEKRLRWKLWWGLLIQDRWLNFAQGTPPYVSKDHYNVPIPTVELLLTPSRADSLRDVRAAEVYIQLCRLTELIGDVLPLIYSFRAKDSTEQISQLEIALDQWMEGQPSWLDLGDFYERPSVPGLVNLQLSYLSVRMLLRRMAWHEISQHDSHCESQRDSNPPSSWLLACQVAAGNIVGFVTSLRKHDLIAFWLPYNAHHFTSAVTLLLRCALQTSDTNVRRQCMTSARALVDCLHKYQEEDKWDLAETCLSQSECVLKRIEDSLPCTLNDTPPTMPSHSVAVDTQSHFKGGAVDEAMPEDVSTMQQVQDSSLEELFPEIFGDWPSDNFFMGQGDFSFGD